MVIQGADLFSEPRLSLALGHGLMLRKRGRLPGDPFEVVLESVGLLTVSARGIVGIIVDVPIFEWPSLGLMMVRTEERRVRSLFDQIVFGRICQGV